MTLALIELSDLGFNWPGQPQLLDIPAFALQTGETLFLKGPSGSGKTTLLGLLGGVQKPTQGSIRLLGQELGELSAGARDRFRVDHTGYIFQQFNLLPFLSVRENVELPCHFSKLRASRAVQRHGSVDQAAATLLAHLGLKDPDLLGRRADSLSIGQQQRVAAARALIGQPELVIADEPTSRAVQRHGSVDQAAATLLAHLGLKDPDLLGRRADSLSIGQQQRVAAARALIGQPELVIADEPTSALDQDAREAFIQLLFSECREAGASLLFVSHDQSLAPLFDRHLSLAELNRAAKPAEV
ncbi:hypothetical protein P308_29290 [Pseudomonas piscis]|nr:hypothetical protein P308_29290 [Pseudomonas piscis]